MAEKAGVSSITVRLSARDGRELVVHVNPQEYDAVLLGLDVVDKLMIPFYTARDGRDDALKFRAEVERQLEQTGVAFVLHQARCRHLVPPIDWEQDHMEL